MQGATQKKASEKDIAGMTKGLMMNHNAMHGGLDLTDASRSLASGGASLEGAASSLTDVRALLPEDLDDENEGEEADNEEEKDKEEGEEPKPKAKTKWFDRDRALSKVNKQMQSALDKQREAAEKALKVIGEQQAEIKVLPAHNRKTVSTDLAILTQRQMFTDALFGPDEKLRGLILQVTAVGGSQASFKGDPASLLGKSGPCRLYKELVTFDRWQSASSSILHAEDEDGLERCKKECNEMKAPIVDLLSAVKSVTADVGRSLKALKTARDEEAAQKKVRKAASCATGSSASAVSIFSLSSYMKAIPVLGEGIGVETSCDLGRPILIEGDSAKVDAFENEPSIRSEILTEFMQLFLAQGAAQKLDRAQKRFPAGSDVQSRIAARMKEIMPRATLPEDLPGPLKQALETQAVIVAKNSFRLLTEKHHAGHLLVSRSAADILDGPCT